MIWEVAQSDMTGTEKPDNDAAASPGTALAGTQNELASLQSAARWVVGAAAAILATLVAGVHLAALGKLGEDEESWRLPVAIVACLVALGVVAVILSLAARVLIHPAWSLNRLAHLDQAGKWKSHWLKEQLDWQRGILIPDEELVPKLLYRRHRKLLKAWFELQEHGSTSVPKILDVDDDRSTRVSYDLRNEEEVARLRARLDSAILITDSVSLVANLIAVRRRYRHLVYALWVGVLAVIAIPVFVWATTIDPEPAVTVPIAAHVQLTSNEMALTAAHLPLSCRGLIVDGIAVGGTMPRPVIVSTANPKCVLSRVRITPEVGTAILVPPQTTSSTPN